MLATLQTNTFVLFLRLDGQSGKREAAKLCWAGENVLKLSLNVSLSPTLSLSLSHSLMAKIDGAKNCRFQPQRVTARKAARSIL